MQFSLADSIDPSTTPQDVFAKFAALINAPSATLAEENAENMGGYGLGVEDCDDEEEDEDDDEKDIETSDETDDPVKLNAIEKRRKKLGLAKLKKKGKKRAYEFTGESGVVGIVFLDIGRITDLPPERNSMHALLRTERMG